MDKKEIDKLLFLAQSWIGQAVDDLNVAIENYKEEGMSICVDALLEDVVMGAENGIRLIEKIMEGDEQ